MNLLRLTPYRLLLAVAVLAIVHLVMTYPHLPDRVPHHFGLSGEADAWSSKTSVAGLHVVLLIVLMATFIGTPLLLPRLGDAFINIPHKEYWLAPERREQSLQELTLYLGWVGVLTILLIHILTMQTFYIAKHGPPYRLPFGWPLILTYLAAIGWITIRMYVRFNRPPKTKLSR